MGWRQSKALIFMGQGGNHFQFFRKTILDMGSIIKLRLKKAIILEDARRIDDGVKTINNIRQLALLMVRTYPGRYVFENINVWLCKLNTTGIKNIDQTYVMKQTIEDLCKVLNINEEELINEIECVNE